MVLLHHQQLHHYYYHYYYFLKASLQKGRKEPKPKKYYFNLPNYKISLTWKTSSTLKRVHASEHSKGKSLRFWAVHKFVLVSSQSPKDRNHMLDKLGNLPGCQETWRGTWGMEGAVYKKKKKAITLPEDGSATGIDFCTLSSYLKDSGTRCSWKELPSPGHPGSLWP